MYDNAVGIGDDDTAEYPRHCPSWLRSQDLRRRKLKQKSGEIWKKRGRQQEGDGKQIVDEDVELKTAMPVS